MHLNLLNDIKIIPVEPAAAAGQTTLTTDVVDTQGFDSVAFVVYLGDVTDTSVLTLTAKTNTANSTSSPTPTTLSQTVTFTADATSADSKLLILDLHKPRDRYVFATLARGTANAVVNGILAVLYNAHQCPVTQSTDVIASEWENDPASA